ncbi:hypothetical protein PybrP1_001077 [[Pythium] brassicae (nom. inval.)]|nr:hypothetical protein PybrP1_001077 [[Pythium] brassicae (nom. inval.)]
MEIGPPIATDANPVAAELRPSAPRASRPRSALCFGSSVGSSQKRPLTAQRSGLDSDRVCIQAADAAAARAIREAARREQEHDAHRADPLRGRSVEPRTVEMATRSCASVQNAVSLLAFARVRGFQARAKGDYAGAAKHYAKAVEVAPRDRVSLFQLAVALERAGSLQPALATYEQVIALDDGNCFAHFNVGNLLMQLGRVADAIRHYSAAIERCGPGEQLQRREFFHQRGAAYRTSGDFEKAARDYAQCHAARALVLRQDERPWGPEAPTEAESSSVEQAATSEPRESNAPRPTNKIVYSSDPLYAAPEASEQLETPIDAWTREQVVRIVALSPLSRTTSDVQLLADALGALFPFCAALSPDARIALATRAVGGANLQAGTPLCLEKQRGSHVFLVYRGRVCVHKTVVKQIAQVTASAKVSGERDREPGVAFDDIMRSCESVFATVSPQRNDDAREQRELAAVIDQLAPVSRQWLQRQMPLCRFGLGRVIGFQGRHSGVAREYSATVDEESDVLALSWPDLLEADSVTSFLRTVPVFQGIPVSELRELSLRAKRVKPVGSKVVCSEGQLVDGVFVVRAGEVCRFAPSDLRLPPDLSISFNLCGSFAGPAHELETSGREFFTQLEFAGDPLAFAHLSAVVHGFLPHDFVESRLRRLQRLATAAASGAPETLSAKSPATPTRPRKQTILAGSARHVTALSLHRGGVFIASSSWIPPRKSRHAGLSCLGVACAKSALVTCSTADLLFFASADVTASLSPASRDALQRNTQAVGDSSRDAGARQRRPEPTTAECQDMLAQRAWTASWAKYKTKLVQEIVHDKRVATPRNCFQTVCGE